MANAHSIKRPGKSSASSKLPYFTLNETTGRYHARRSLTRKQIVRAALVACRQEYGRRGASFSGSRDACPYLMFLLGGLKAEAFCVLFLDNGNRLLAVREMFHGTINGVSVHPREVVRAAIDLGAAAVILAHNHPSGNAEPSPADQHITSRLAEALGLIDVRVLDHIIVGNGECVSFAERGLI